MLELIPWVLFLEVYADIPQKLIYLYKAPIARA